MELKFFKVTCKCGHVGRDHFIRIDFPIRATNGKEAAEIARMLPRVKHHHKDAILACVEITEEEFETLKEKNKYDPYLRCVNPQEQSLIFDLYLHIEKEAGVAEPKKNKRASIGYRQKKQEISEREAWDYEEDDFEYAEWRLQSA